MVQAAGGDDEVVAAALLHDVLEDTSYTATQLRQIMPSRVVDLVLECTEVGTSSPRKAPWQERKDAYITHLSQVTPHALLISVADKLQSLRELKCVARVRGDAAYSQLVKSAGELSEQKRLTIWFNDQVWRAANLRLDTLRAAPLTWFPGLEALLLDYGDVIDWLERR
jgi:hypothetical protein